MNTQFLTLAALLLSITTTLANPCPDNLRWNALTNMCESTPLKHPMDFTQMKQSDEGKAKMRAMCNQMATEDRSSQTMWLTPSGDRCAFCVPGTTYDPVSQICM